MELAALEKALAQLPVYQYAFMRPEDLPFSERVQQVCQMECPMYGKSWSCPPAVGSVTACRARCLCYDSALLLVTAHEVEHSAELMQALTTKPLHTALVEQVRDLLEAEGKTCLCLSGDACAHCDGCSWPQPCRQPRLQMPCLEGYGVVVSELAEGLGISFPPEPGLVYWYAVILF